MLWFVRNALVYRACMYIKTALTCLYINNDSEDSNNDDSANPNSVDLFLQRLILFWRFLFRSSNGTKVTTVICLYPCLSMDFVLIRMKQQQLFYYCKYYLENDNPPAFSFTWFTVCCHQNVPIPNFFTTWLYNCYKPKIPMCLSLNT